MFVLEFAFALNDDFARMINWEKLPNFLFAAIIRFNMNCKVYTFSKSINCSKSSCYKLQVNGQSHSKLRSIRRSNDALLATAETICIFNDSCNAMRWAMSNYNRVQAARGKIYSRFLQHIIEQNTIN